jgi:hypothetical protein
MKFWDTSAIIPLCLDEPLTTDLKKVLQEDAAIAVWWATPVECLSAFARLRREGVLTQTGEDQARNVLACLAEEWTEIEPSREIRHSAARILLLHPLRAADSLQLAAALIWTQGRTAGYHFTCLDQRLREAAHREGFAVLPDIREAKEKPL